MAKIFIIDDDKMFLQTVEKILLRLGYEVDTCNDSTQAVERVKNGNYDLVLTDLQMPIINGIDVAREIIALNRDMEVLMITGYATLDAALQAMKVGIYDIILKPASLDQIQSSVGRAIEKLRLQRENRELLEALRRRDENVQLLQAIGQYIKESPTLDEVLFFIGETLEAQMGISEYSLFQLTPDNSYERILKHHKDDPFHGIDELLFSREEIETIYSHSKPYALSVHESSISPFDLLTPSEITEDSSFIVVPLISYSRLVGFFLLRVDSSRQIDNTELANLLELFSNLVSHLFFSLGNRLVKKEMTLSAQLQKIIQDSLDQKHLPDESVHFCVLFLSCSDLSACIWLEEVDIELTEIIRDNLGRNVIIHNLFPGFYFLKISRMDYQTVEIKVNKLSSAISRFLEQRDFSSVNVHLTLTTQSEFRGDAKSIIKKLTHEYV